MNNETADRVDTVTNKLEATAQAVQSNVQSGIQPDIRELRNLMADLRETVSISFRRIFWAIIILGALNLIGLMVLLAR
jgi:hypothetical protein